MPPPPISNLTPKALSLGVSEYSPWDLEMAKRGYKVIQYDGSIKKAPDTHENLSFHKKFINTFTSKNTLSLEDAITQNALDEKAHNILQVDIENAEWDILQKLDIALLEKYFSQVIFEFHQLDPLDYENTNKQIEVFKKLNQHYNCIHAHFNNHGGCVYSRSYFWGYTIELSYLRKDLMPKEFELRKQCGDLEGLDYPNAAANPEIPLRFFEI